MKVKISTWIERGVTHQDIENWTFQGLVGQEYRGLEPTGIIWTLKSPSKWPQEAKDRYYETAGMVAKATGERQKAWNAQSKAEWAKVIELYGEGVRQVSHRCNAEQYASVHVTAQGRAFNYDGTPHFCDGYVEPVEQSPANVEPRTDEYTYCPKCQAECGWTANTQYSDIGYCPKCGTDCILPENHPVRVAHRAWVANMNAIECPEHEVEPETENVTIITTAPEAYDYGYCVSETLPWTRNDNPLRRVTLPAEDVKHQTGRYRSGMYETLTPEEFEYSKDLYEPEPKAPKAKPNHNQDCNQAIKKFFGKGSSINELLDRTCPDCHIKIKAPNMKAYPAWLDSRVAGTPGPSRLQKFF